MMRIAVIGPGRYPIRQPYAGGLETMVASLVAGLRAAGHEVDLFAARGSEGHVREVEFPGVEATTDTGYPPGTREAETAAFRKARAYIAGRGYDVIHNNSLHPLPLAIAGSGGPALLTTLHTPPTVEMRTAVRTATGGHYAAVSAFTAGQWRLPRAAEVVPNGVDVNLWRPGPGGDRAVWFGRVIPEKAPHLAVEAARRAGVPLALAGRVGDERYARTVLRPAIDAAAPGQITWHGEMRHRELAALVGSSSVCLVTPVWDEPFGLVTAEAAACGTPVAAFARGGIAEYVAPDIGRTAAGGDVAGLAEAMRAAMALDRRAVRAAAERDFALERMIARYEGAYRRITRTVRV